MANKVNTAIAAIRTALAAVGGGTTFKAVTGKLVNPLRVKVRLPYCSVKAGDCRHVGGPQASRQWSVQYVVQIVTACSSDSVELELIDLIAAAESALDSVGSAAGCVVCQPQWIVQETLGETTVANWAIGTGELQITGPLLTS
ncbi:MAG: hypothetical protein BWX88_02761 [Planctomycetes bacterium ADurb.Bin126]|nr:MAG: hypothetical protein BWX88_02761 [Planctomycetes bacterium ADurb.Bin126]HOD79954.1 hypothetical protein [Phycisphaerae bacterium]HQL73231.1 hypothetical protein [Phycisphaerae bacterium]